MNLAQKILDELSRDTAHNCIVELDAAAHAVRHLQRGELLAQSAAWQKAMRGHGLRPGDPVGVGPARDARLPAVHLAALSSGFVVVPVNDALSATEREALLAEAEIDRVFGEAGDPVPAAGERGLEIVARESADPAMRLYTSGTTGKPKSVPLSHGNLLYDLEALAHVWERTDTDRLLHMLPAHHFHGLVLATYGSLLCGCEVLLLPRFDARTALDAVAAHDITLLMGVPTMYARMLEAARPDDDLSRLRLAISGSAPLMPSTWERFRQRFDVELVERYGLTETGIVATNPPGRAKPGSVGIALQGTRIAIAEDGVLREGAARGRGEICVRGPSVMAGYGNAPEANRAAFVDGWFKTGDLGYFDDDGYLHIDGRLKELIIVGGSNVVPGEVERALEGVAGVNELAVAGLPHDDLGEIVAVFVTLEAGADTTKVRAGLERTASERLAAYKRPRRYVFLSELPRNAMGKIDRGKLAAG